MVIKGKMNAKIKIILVLILLIPLVYLFSSGTFSYFSDTEVSTGNTFTAGTWYVPEQADDLEADTSSSFIGPLKHGLHNINVNNTGSSDITIEKIWISWNPDLGENVTRVLLWDWNLTTKIKVWEGKEPSGTTFDIIDCTVEPWENKFETNIFGFWFDSNSNMEGKEFTIEFIMGDGSSEEVTFTPKYPCLEK